LHDYHLCKVSSFRILPSKPLRSFFPPAPLNPRYILLEPFHPTMQRDKQLRYRVGLLLPVSSVHSTWAGRRTNSLYRMSRSDTFFRDNSSSFDLSRFLLIPCMRFGRKGSKSIVPSGLIVKCTGPVPANGPSTVPDPSTPLVFNSSISLRSLSAARIS